MNINTELYKTFYCVAKEGSISKAAEQLYITQPAVSRSIQQLEEKIGCKLFFRIPKGVKLTSEGQMLYMYVEKAFNFLYLGEKKISEMKELEIGDISIGVGDTICKHYLVPHLKQFNHNFPAVNIHVTNQKTDVIIEMLKKGKIDIGIINLPVEDEQLLITKVMEIHDCFVVGSKYRHLSLEDQSIIELVKYPIMLVEKGSNSRAYIDKYFETNGIDIKPEIELGNFELLAQFAMIDFGIACIIREFFLDEMEKGLLYEIKTKEHITSRNIGLAHLKSVPLSAAAKKLINFLSF
jgi:DNA-binding transcriptional LysR family regulator